MTRGKPATAAKQRGFMASLARDVRGNTLAMMAMFLIPLTGLVGSAIDMSRLYVVKARLQQACDAGVLAGRKFMVSTAAPLDTNAATQAGVFFTNNFKKDTAAVGATPATTGFMGSTAVTFTPVQTADNQVAGTASAAVPMTITKMFGTSSVTLNVTCQARFDVADTDVMFVLDTTGSMACLPGGPDTCGTAVYAYTRPSTSNGVPGYAGTVGAATRELTSGGANVSRIQALRTAVLNFYDTFAANADPSTNVRYGFVTYSSVVNAGKAIMDVTPSSMVGGTGSELQSYQSRQVYGDAVSSTTTNSSNNGKSQSNCNASVRTPSAAKTYSSSTYVIPAATGASQNTGPVRTASRVYDYWSNSRCQTRTDTLIPQYQYLPLSYDASYVVQQGLTVPDPTKLWGQTTQWIGCVETPVDNPGQSTFVTTNLPSELNPDIFPTGSQRWWPHIHDVVYARNGWNNSNTDYSNGDDAYNNPNYGVDPYVASNGSYTNSWLRDSGYTTCGKPVKRLGVMSRQDVYNYVYATDFVPEGGTYHDTGMIWGTRLIAPNGPWSADTAAWPNRNPPNRVIIFLTDGDMAPNAAIYGMYGIEALDHRVQGSTSTDLTTLHNARFLAECAAAKARNISIWTVSIASSANAQLTACASTPGQALATTNGTGLSTAFTTIAKQLAFLRITK